MTSPSSRLMRRLGPVTTSEGVYRTQHLLRSPSSGHLVLGVDSQDVPLPTVVDGWSKQLYVDHATGGTSWQSAFEAWNSSLASCGADMEAAFDSAQWAEFRRSPSSADEDLARNYVDLRSQFVIRHYCWARCLSVPLPTAATGLSTLAAVTLTVRPYQTNPTRWTHSDCPLRFAADVSSSDPPVLSSSDIEALPHADADMSSPDDYREITISGNWDCSGGKRLHLFVFPAGFRPPAALPSATSGTTGRASAYVKRSTHFAYGGWRITARMEA